MTRMGLTGWFIRGTAAAALAATGCCCMSSAPPAGMHPSASADASAAQDVRFGRTAADAPAGPGGVNVFGEMKGYKASFVRSAGESNFQQHTFIDEGYDADVTADATGKWLAFSSTRDSEHPAIYLQRSDGNAVVQLTGGTSDDAYPAFSPDGKRIAFSSTRAGNWQIFVMDADGRNVTQVTVGPMQSIHPSWAPDGNRIVYCTLGSRSNQWELWTVNLQTNENRMIGYGLFPSWSPSREADRIAFQRPRQRGSRWFSLWTLDLVNGEARALTEVAVSTNAAILSPSWSPDGRRLAFATVLDPEKNTTPHARGRTDVWTISADGTERQRLTDGTGTNLMPFWAGDNRIYFISDRGGAECVWSVRTTKKSTVPPAQAADTRDPGGS